MEKNELPHTIGRQIIETETKWIPLANIHDHPISLKTYNSIAAKSTSKRHPNNIKYTVRISLRSDIKCNKL